tara:strand:+ start:3708 stop:3881 length:174 start_codon:yes stop_codon:yes gene_type:complete
MVSRVVPDPPPLLKTAAGLPLLALRTTKDLRRVLPPIKLPVEVTVLAMMELAIIVSY